MLRVSIKTKVTGFKAQFQTKIIPRLHGEKVAIHPCNHPSMSKGGFPSALSLLPSAF